MLAPILDEAKESTNELAKALNDAVYKISEDDFGRKFSISLSFWLDSFPLIPKTILIVKQPREKKEAIVIAVLVGTTFVEMRFVGRLCNQNEY